MIEIVRSASLLALARRCVAVLAQPPDDAFTPEWIATPTPGIARWLALELARDLGASGDGADDGIAANIDFRRGGSLRRAVLAADPDGPGDAEPWRTEPVTWALAALRSTGDADLGLPTLATGAPLTGWAGRTARLFVRYDIHRPGMVRAWAAGRDVDGDGNALPVSDRWQPRLFRALRDHFGVGSPAERLPGVCARLRNDDLPVDLPGRLFLFGFTVPPGGGDFVQLVHAVSTRRDVHCYLSDPSPTADPEEWSELAASWAGAAADSREVVRDLDVPAEPLPTGTAAPTGSLLGHLQHRIVDPLASSPASDGQPAAAPPTDMASPSIQVHGAQGTRRQVEVLRDALLGLLRDQADLREDDILVVCTDLERFAPHIQTVFGGSGSAVTGGSGSAADVRPAMPAGTPGLRYRIDDARGQPENPVAIAVRRALELVNGRFSAVDVLEFCSLRGVRNRWGFDDDALATIRRWAVELDVRWGADTAHRAEVGVPASVPAGTWRRALDRLALGAVFARDDLIVGEQLVPVAVEGDGVDVLGRVVDLVARLVDFADDAARAYPVHERLPRLERTLDALVAPDDDAAWQRDVLARMCRLDPAEGLSVGDLADGLVTTLADLLPQLLGRLDAGGRRNGSFRGGVTVTGPGELAGVPFRVVCVLGLDDDALPGGARSGDDLCSRHPVPGDPDARGDLLGVLLASVVNAGDHLLVFHDHRDLRTNETLPDSTPLAELCVEIDAVMGSGDIAPAYRIEHPRHGSDRRCFVAGAIVPGVPWSFDTRALAGARARSLAAASPSSGDVAGGADPAPVPASGADPAVASAGGAPEPVPLADVLAFWKDPARSLCRRVLDVRFPDEEDELASHLRTELAPLERHALTQEFLDRHLDAAVDADEAGFAALLTARDRLPVGILGTAALQERSSEGGALAAAARAVRVEAEPENLTLDCLLPGGRRLVGSVAVRRCAGDLQVFDARASTAKVGDRLRAWIELLTIGVVEPGTALESVLVRRNPKKRVKRADATYVIRLRADTAEQRAAHLASMMDWFDAWCRRPFPLSFGAFGAHLLAGDGADWPEVGDPELQKAWNDASRYDEPLRFLSGDRDVDALIDEPATDDDPGPADIDGRIQRFAAAVDAAWAATVDPEESGAR